ncbi:MAG TPA: carboxylesterase family protein [Candidatus Aquabacterium excrementipullorum]|nr:carboxylesterase family protein [Candidatus Aquabacterium excrementipullorum]
MSRFASRLVKPLLGALASVTALLFGAVAPAQAQTTVQVEQGLLAGQSVSGVRQFLGIPYGQAPVGALRWKAPQPALAWTGTRSATQFGSACPQYAGLFAEASVNEDCLSLNVYAPPALSQGKRPVIVWVHGGAFQVGTGDQYDGSVMATKTGAIVVTINYRLGAFGFLTTSGMAGESGGVNFGLQDQWLALRWVKRNIEAFGGDAGKVTMAGQSSGGTSGCLALASPKARGLFDRVIMQSASCGIASKPLAASRAYGDALADRVGCPAGSGQMACLRAKSVDDLLAASPSYVDSVTKFDIWSATEDGVTLPMAPLKAMALGRVNRVPVMLGSNRDEGRGFILPLFHLGYGRVMDQADYDSVAGYLLGSAAPVYQSLYSAANYGSVDVAASSLITDKVFSCVANRMANSLSKVTPTYAFEFADRTAPQFSPDPFIDWLAFHGGDLQYVFQSTVAGIPQDPLNAQQQALGDQMLRYWKAFITTGNPNNTTGAAPLPTTPWPAFNVLTTPFQRLEATGVSTQGFGAFQTEHHCLAWTLESLF